MFSFRSRFRFFSFAFVLIIILLARTYVTNVVSVCCSDYFRLMLACCPGTTRGQKWAFSTALPYICGDKSINQTISGLSPKRNWGSKRVKTHISSTCISALFTDIVRVYTDLRGNTAPGPRFDVVSDVYKMVCAYAAALAEAPLRSLLSTRVSFLFPYLS